MRQQLDVGGTVKIIPFTQPLLASEVAAANALFAAESGVTAHIEEPLVLRLEGDVRRFWFGRVVDQAGAEIGPSFAPRASGKGAQLCQRYDCTPHTRHGAAMLRLRMVFPDEPLSALEGVSTR
jgi:hypothetical protein